MAERSLKQRMRQNEEYRKNGRYAKTNPCELCGKSTGADYDYWSHERCNEWGIGVVLHRDCQAKLSAMPDEEAKSVLVEARRKQNR